MPGTGESGKGKGKGKKPVHPPDDRFGGAIGQLRRELRKLSTFQRAHFQHVPEQRPDMGQFW